MQPRRLWHFCNQCTVVHDFSAHLGGIASQISETWESARDRAGKALWRGRCFVRSPRTPNASVIGLTLPGTLGVCSPFLRCVPGVGGLPGIRNPAWIFGDHKNRCSRHSPQCPVCSAVCRQSFCLKGGFHLPDLAAPKCLLGWGDEPCF